MPKTTRQYGHGLTTIQRFEQRVRRTTECWHWIGAHNTRGYSLLSDGYRRTLYAHRFAYLHFNGEIPDGHELDHLCTNPGCVNPNHLEPVTHQENCQRHYRQSREA